LSLQNLPKLKITDLDEHNLNLISKRTQEKIFYNNPLNCPQKSHNFKETIIQNPNPANIKDPTELSNGISLKNLKTYIQYNSINI